MGLHRSKSNYFTDAVGIFKDTCTAEKTNKVFQQEIVLGD